MEEIQIQFMDGIRELDEENNSRIRDAWDKLTQKS